MSFETCKATCEMWAQAEYNPGVGEPRYSDMRALVRWATKLYGPNDLETSVTITNPNGTKETMTFEQWLGHRDLRVPTPSVYDTDKLTVTVTGSGSSQDAALRERLLAEGIFVDPAKPIPPVDRSQETQEWWTGHVSTPTPKSRGEEIAGKRIKAGNGTGIIFYTPDGEPDVSVVPVSESTQIGTLADLREWFAAAIDQAIAEEREACGEVAEQLPGRRGAMNRQAAALASTLASLIAAAIRARGSK